MIKSIILCLLFAEAFFGCNDEDWSDENFWPA